MKIELEKGLISVEETSTKNRIYESLIANQQKTLSDEKKKNQIRQLRFGFSYGQFCELLKTEGMALLQRKRQAQNFIIDSGNESVISQLYLYSTLNPDFQGDLHKGVMLQGKVGCGKTVLLKSYVSMKKKHICLKFAESTESIKSR